MIHNDVEANKQAVRELDRYRSTQSGRINLKSMLFFPKLIDKFNAISIRIPHNDSFWN